MKVSIGNFSSALYTLNLSRAAPGLYEYSEAQSGRVFVAAQDERFQLVGTVNPVQRGSFLILYANGLGPVTNRPPTGEFSSESPRSTTINIPSVTIGGRPADVTF